VSTRCIGFRLCDFLSAEASGQSLRLHAACSTAAASDPQCLASVVTPPASRPFHAVQAELEGTGDTPHLPCLAEVCLRVRNDACGGAASCHPTWMEDPAMFSLGCSPSGPFALQRPSESTSDVALIGARRAKRPMRSTGKGHLGSMLLPEAPKRRNRGVG
jgi:hypothetical protein